MHPILFRIPLPNGAVPALYFYLAVIALGLLYAAAMFFVRKDRNSAIGGVVVAGVALFLKFTGVLESLTEAKDGTIQLAPIPIYSYGVMLGLSLVVGWYLTLTLAKKDGLPQETMANNYVITAVAAIAGSRILYVLTNLSEFDSPIDVLALRRGGLVAYGGFLGGFVGSWWYLRKNNIPLLPWADVAVPSLASGLMITRIGCYLFGCDFGRPLCGTAPFPDCASPEAAPAWLQKLGSFPRWAPGLLHEGNASEGSPAWTQHVRDKLIDAAHDGSLPVHPTQLYESLVGASLLGLLLFARTKQKFRGQIFLLFTFAYGFARYMLEILRDDRERGSIPISGDKHIIVALGLAILAAGFVIGFSKEIKNAAAQRVAQAASFIPAIAMFFALRPTSFGDSASYQWSTSQFVAIVTGFGACVAFSVFHKAAEAHPEAAMRINLPAPQNADEDPAVDDRAADTDADDEEEAAPAKKPAAKKPVAGAKAKAGAKSVKKAVAKKVVPVADEDDADEADADADADADAKAGKDDEKPKGDEADAKGDDDATAKAKGDDEADAKAKSDDATKSKSDDEGNEGEEKAK